MYGKGSIESCRLGWILAQRSTSLAALRIALEGAAEAEATTELLDIKKLALPMYDPAAKNPPEAVIRMCDAVYQANGLIWSSPCATATRHT
jgi:FMN reductase